MEEITLSGRDVYVSVLGFVATLNFQRAHNSLMLQDDTLSGTSVITVE